MAYVLVFYSPSKLLGYFNTLSKMLALNKKKNLGWDYKLFIAHSHDNDETNILPYMVVVVASESHMG